MTQRSSFPIAVAAGLLIVALVLGVFVWQPARGQVSVLSDDLAGAESELTALEIEMAELVALETELPQANSERERLLEAVPTELSQDELIQDLEAISKEVGVTLNAMTFSLQNTQGAGPSVITIVASFSGSYSDLINLLEAIENNDRLFKIASIGVQLSEVEGSEDEYMTFSVSIEAYYQ